MKDERFVHRLEAFSDIVIGFSLAQLGATLVLPPHPQSLLSNPGWFFAFCWTFALVCSMWWNHNRVFRIPFHPTTAALIANFTLLASIVLLIFFAELFAHAMTTPDAFVAARLYFATLAVNYLLTAWLYQAAHGWVRGVAVNGVSALFQLTIVVVLLPLGNNPAALAVMGCAIPLGFVLGRIAGRRFPQAEPVPA
jgi:uncharacterized membrane protein